MRRNAVCAVAVLATGAGTIAGCGGSDRASATGSPGGLPAAAAVEQALRTDGGDLARTLPAEVVTSGDACTPRASATDLFDCSFGQGVGGEDPVAFVVRLQSDGTISKVLGESDPVPGTSSPASAAALLDADDRRQHAPSRTTAYTCKPSPRLDANGERTDANASGQLCTARVRVNPRTIRRYVEIAPDGTATRDYVLRDA